MNKSDIKIDIYEDGKLYASIKGDDLKKQKLDDILSSLHNSVSSKRYDKKLSINKSCNFNRILLNSVLIVILSTFLLVMIALYKINFAAKDLVDKYEFNNTLSDLMHIINYNSEIIDNEKNGNILSSCD